MINPGLLNDALAQWLTGQQGSLAASAAALREAYRRGETSSRVSPAAYVATRLPATFAANLKAHEALAAAWPDFAPTTLLDIGAGPGTASWAALQNWPSLQTLTQCEPDKNFAALLQHVQAASGVAQLLEANLLPVSEHKLPEGLRADLVLASYMLAELPLADMPSLARRLWGRANHILLLVEPGTPQGFARLRAVRDTLLPLGAKVMAPCTHQQACPMAGQDWCHFKVRVQRSRTHMHAKQATVPFEDEAFSYLVLARKAAVSTGARILAPPAVNKVSTTLRLCENGTVREAVIASRDKPNYKRAKNAEWGDTWGVTSVES